MCDGQYLWRHGTFILLLAVAAAAAACAVCMRARHPGLRILAALALGFSAGLLNAAVQDQLRMDDALADMHQDEVSRLVVRVAALPEGDAQRQRFLAELDGPARPGIPSRIQITWQAGAGANQAVAQVLPGQIWRMALVLRRPHGSLNPAGSDLEGRLFVEGMRAVGTVRGQRWASTGLRR